MIIETRGLTKTYGQVHALSNVSLAVPPGATGLLGPNGAGKSTLIRALIGLVRPSSGSGTIFGHDITREGLAIRRRIGYMPEHECLIQDLKAVEMVSYAGQLAGMPRTDAMQRAHEVLHLMGLGDERYRQLETYSTGMMQKVNLAQALVHDPDLLFLDEPTNGLDPKGRVEMLELIGFLAREQGKSIILSSHILRDVEAVCDNIVVLADGEVLMQGDLQEQLRGSADAVNVKIVGERDPFLARLEAQGHKVLSKAGFEVRITASEEHTERLFADIMHAAARTGVQVRYASRAATNLEELFIAAIGQRGRQATGGEA